MSILFENIKLNYCHMTTPVEDKLSNKMVYKFMASIPNTEENMTKLLQEISECKSFAEENKIKALADKRGRIPEPKIVDLDKAISEDGTMINLNLSVQKPITVYDQYGDKLEDCPVRKVNHADIELFAYAWTYKNGWGIKFCPKAVCVKEDFDALMAEQENPGGKCAFSFVRKASTQDEYPFSK